MTRALILEGGWDGHEPHLCADEVAEMLNELGIEVTRSTSLEVLSDALRMASIDLVVPIWTMGVLERAQEQGLERAVRAGTGLAGFHGGMGDAFRASIDYQWMVGGQFVAHPGNIREYRVDIADPDHEITRDASSFYVTTEQYYLHVDPSIHVLADTSFDGAAAPWIDGVVMPVAWTRQHGAGRVFYSALGHAALELRQSDVRQLLARGMRWAARA